MLSVKQVHQRLCEQNEKQEQHQRKLQLIKDEICRMRTQKPTTEELQQHERYNKRMIQLLCDDLDPFSYCFETGSENNAESPSLIVSILKASKKYTEVSNQLNSSYGRFSKGAAFYLMTDLKDYLLDEYKATKKPLPLEDTYNTMDYYLDGNELVFQPVTEFDVSPEKRWALGVIYYYLVTGYPALKGDHQVNFYDEVGLGPRLNTPASNKLVQNGHLFPSKMWQDLSKEVRKCIKGLTCYHPGN